MSVAADRNRLGGLTRADSIGGPGGGPGGGRGSGAGNGAAPSDARPSETVDPISVEELAAPTTALAAPALPRRRRRSSLTRRILTLNLLA
ncbi:MAG TPA: hypothetical protein VF213_08510, partial [Dongiaceae bacterium]